MTDAPRHCDRPWWKRPPVWFLGIALVVALAIGVAVEEAGRRAPMPYGAFLDQLEAGNVASVTFQGTEIDGRLKRPVDTTPASTKAQRDTFRSRVPEFGDPALIATLRNQHVAIDVASSSQWTSLLGRLPLPMVVILGVALIAGAVRLARGGKAQPGSAMSAHPMHGMMELVSGLFGKQPQAAGPPASGPDKQSAA